MPTKEIDSGTSAPMLVNSRTVGVLLGRCERTIWRDDKFGRLPRAVVIGGSKRWCLEELGRWVQAGCPSRLDWESSGRAIECRETPVAAGGVS